MISRIFAFTLNTQFCRKENLKWIGVTSTLQRNKGNQTGLLPTAGTGQTHQP